MTVTDYIRQREEIDALMLKADKARALGLDLNEADKLRLLKLLLADALAGTIDHPINVDAVQGALDVLEANARKTRQ